MHGLLAFQHPATEQQQKQRRNREQFAVHSTYADPHRPFGIGRDRCCCQPAPQIARGLPGDEQGSRDNHDLPQHHAALQVVEQVGKQASDFGLVFHLLSYDAGILRHLERLRTTATACSRCRRQFA
jgi:hypothetical protein